MKQLSLNLPALEESPPDLATYDLILVSISGGKDSQAALDVTVRAARAVGAADRIVAVHADLGEVEWPGTVELAAEHAAHYGLRFELVRREIAGVPQTLLEQIERRGMFPDAARRYCTASAKRDPILKLMTRLVAEQRDGGTGNGPVRVLSVMGMRAAESPARRRRPAFRHSASRTCTCVNCRALPAEQLPARGASNSRRHVDEWLPLHTWSEQEVWERIRAAGTRSHAAYALGMPRLSCVFCVLSSRSALVRAAQLQPGLAARYAEVEARIGHRFRADLTMEQVIREASTSAAVLPVVSWSA